jgi:hypothetical protein
MEITIKTASFDGDDIDCRIESLMEDNAKARCTPDEMSELVGLLHFRNDNHPGDFWGSNDWESFRFVLTSGADNSLKARVREHFEELHDDVEFYANPFCHIDWDKVAESAKTELTKVCLTINGETGTYYMFGDQS